ncbi:MAG: RNA polymerase sigma factor [Bacteroidota bacterium]
MHNASLLQDAVQETFLLIFKSLPSSFQEEKGALKPWIRKIAINSSLKFNQRYQDFEELAQQEYEKQYFAIAEITTQTSDQEILLLIRAIPPSYREVFNLYAIDGYSHQEIAKLLGISIQSSRKKLQRARANLQEQLKRQQKINFTKSA